MYGKQMKNVLFSAKGHEIKREHARTADTRQKLTVCVFDGSKQSIVPSAVLIKQIYMGKLILIVLIRMSIFGTDELRNRKVRKAEDSHAESSR